MGKTHFELDFCATPLGKQVLTILGDQSSGKSSLINHLFGTNVRMTGAEAVDSQFTILESVPEEEFIEMILSSSSSSSVGNASSGNVVQGENGTNSASSSSASASSVSSSSFDAIKRKLDQRAKRMEREHGPNWMYGHVDRMETDRRKGLVWIELNQISKVKRYRQFFESHMKSIFLKYDSLVKCIIVNERFVNASELDVRNRGGSGAVGENGVHNKNVNKKTNSGSGGGDSGGDKDDRDDAMSEWNVILPKQRNRFTVSNLIIVDSPGYNEGSVIDMEKFKANIELLEFFYKQSALVLFMASPTHLLSMGNALYMLQLTVLDQATRNKMFQQVHQQMVANAAIDHGAGGGGGSGLLGTVISSCYNSLENRVTNIWNSACNLTEDYFGGGGSGGGGGGAGGVGGTGRMGSAVQDSASYKYFGGSIYDKLYFVINKIDICRNTNYVYYEFGTALGRRFKHLPIPPANHIMIIGIPMEQRMQRISHLLHDKNNEQWMTQDIKKIVPIESLAVGQLRELEYLLETLKEDKHVQTSLINHIQYVFESIQEVYKNMSYYRQYRSQKYFQESKAICDNCCLLDDR